VYGNEMNLNIAPVLVIVLPEKMRVQKYSPSNWNNLEQ